MFSKNTVTIEIGKKNLKIPACLVAKIVSVNELYVIFKVTMNFPNKTFPHFVAKVTIMCSPSILSSHTRRKV